MMREGWKKYQKSDATDRDVARHICFTHDFMYSVLDTSPLPGGRTIWINDLKGVRCACLCAVVPPRLPDHRPVRMHPEPVPSPSHAGKALAAAVAAS